MFNDCGSCDWPNLSVFNFVLTSTFCSPKIQNQTYFGIGRHQIIYMLDFMCLHPNDCFGLCRPIRKRQMTGNVHDSAGNAP